MDATTAITAALILAAVAAALWAWHRFAHADDDLFDEDVCDWDRDDWAQSETYRKPEPDNHRDHI